MPVHKSRGAVSAPAGRFARQQLEFSAEEAQRSSEIAPRTVLTAMQAGRIISSNESPDVPFNRSINPYQGCEHGCIYCYARPSHSYLDLSPGLDFETRIFYKPNAAERLLAAWEQRDYECEPITIGANTDPYQPAEKSTLVTRSLLEVFKRHQHPVNLITKSALITRDIDLLSWLAERNLCSVAVSVPTLDVKLKRIMEPRVPSAEARLKAIKVLSSNGIPTSVLVAPIIPAINDAEIERILEAVAEAGATHASYIFLRLPHEVRELFIEWLQAHFPDRAAHVMSLVRQASGGKDYDNRFGVRQRGRGPYADVLSKRFQNACKRFGLAGDRYQRTLDCTRFARPGVQQLGLNL
ncbi:MAG: PA0069 family radical SAM protein [Gammaproteobacteria bacterium]|nr:PA0069 family radical SAM protein [Gammaproteobacteria bacterium]MDH5303987.1 PA0069 family radical SAM protein [Gammaproteobacteria bacterium]MDH5321748.1 PA0069 family radical SAM protein [Gammaproteobacteria bacterium]